MKKFTLLLILAATLLGAGTVLAAKDTNMVACSVCGYMIPKDQALTTVYEGKTYYFCEAGCKAYFLQNPAEMSAAKDVDPVCGMMVEKAGSIEVVNGGRQIHFCSNACKEKYLANPAEYAINYDVVSNVVKPEKEMKYTTTFEGRPMYFVSEENKVAFDKNPDAYIYAECPVSGKVFLRKDAGATVAYDGKTRYFCCKNCLERFNKDPKKYSGPASSTGKSYSEAKAGDAPKAKTCGKK
jgi:YHS domain-containing protein